MKTKKKDNEKNKQIKNNNWKKRKRSIEKQKMKSWYKKGKETASKERYTVQIVQKQNGSLTCSPRQ